LREPDVVVAVLGVKGKEVRIGVQAPKSVPVHREEVFERIQEEQRPGKRAPLAR
jgi:carbon storage regulator